jgi:hypothetical protein
VTISWYSGGDDVYCRNESYGSPGALTRLRKMATLLLVFNESIAAFSVNHPEMGVFAALIE